VFVSASSSVVYGMSGMLCNFGESFSRHLGAYYRLVSINWSFIISVLLMVIQ